MVQAIPTGYAGVTPYLIVRDAARALDFYKKAFGATELMRFPAPGGKIGHAEIKIGEGVVMLADESPEMGHKSPQTIGGTPVSLMFYVADVDAQLRQGARRRRRGHESAQGPVLWRSQRDDHRSVRPCLDDRHAHRGRLARGDAAAHGGDVAGREDDMTASDRRRDRARSRCRCRGRGRIGWRLSRAVPVAHGRGRLAAAWQRLRADPVRRQPGNICSQARSRRCGIGIRSTTSSCTCSKAR